jgi:hypothetical protein
LAASWWLVPCATYRLPHSFAGRFRRWRRGLLLFFSGAAGRPEKPLRRASPSLLRRAPVAATGGLAVARLLCSTALLFPAHPLNSPPHRSRSRRPATPATSSRSFSQKEKSHWKPRADPLPSLPVPRRKSRVVPVASTAVRLCLPGRTPAPHRLSRLSRGRSASCKIHLPRTQPYVQRAKLNTAASTRINPSTTPQVH